MTNEGVGGGRDFSGGKAFQVPFSKPAGAARAPFSRSGAGEAWRDPGCFLPLGTMKSAQDGALRGSSPGWNRTEEGEWGAWDSFSASQRFGWQRRTPTAWPARQSKPCHLPAPTAPSLPRRGDSAPRIPQGWSLGGRSGTFREQSVGPVDPKRMLRCGQTASDFGRRMPWGFAGFGLEAKRISRAAAPWFRVKTPLFLAALSPVEFCHDCGRGRATGQLPVGLPQSDPPQSPRPG